LYASGKHWDYEGIIMRSFKYRAENFVLISWDCLPHLIAVPDMLIPV